MPLGFEDEELREVHGKRNFGGGSLMKRRVVQIVCGVTVLLGGCSGGTPSEGDVRPAVADLLKEYGALTDFRKTDGETLEINGQKTYIFHYLAATKLDGGWSWQKGNILFPTGLVRGDPVKGGFGAPEMMKVPNGATFAGGGKVTFRQTEKGWRLIDAELAEYRFCAEKSASDCYQELAEHRKK